MSGDLTGHSRHHEAVFGALSVGFFFVLVGLLFISTPNLVHDATTFLSHWENVHLRSVNVTVPVPQHLGDYVDVYEAARNFSLVWGIFLGVMLAARFILDSSTRRKARNAGSIAFWLGTAFLIQALLVETTETSTIDVRIWLEFWAGIIVLIGLSLIVRAILLAAARATRST